MLKHIKTQVCPKCGAVPIRETASERTHVNGNRNEERSFACDYAVEHVPNYADRDGNHERFLGECTRDPEYQDKVKARQNLIRDIRELITATDIIKKDPAFVERIYRELVYIGG